MTENDVDYKKEYFILERYRITQEVNRPYVDYCFQILLIVIISVIVVNMIGVFFTAFVAYQYGKNTNEMVLTFAHSVAALKIFTVGTVSSILLAGCSFIAQSVYIRDFENRNSRAGTLAYVCAMLFFVVSIFCFALGVWVFVGV